MANESDLNSKESNMARIPEGKKGMFPLLSSESFSLPARRWRRRGTRWRRRRRRGRRGRRGRAAGLTGVDAGKLLWDEKRLQK